MTTSHEYRGYIFTIAYEAKRAGLHRDFPDVPEIITSGDTLAGAFANACGGSRPAPGEPAKIESAVAQDQSITWSFNSESDICKVTLAPSCLDN